MKNRKLKNRRKNNNHKRNKQKNKLNHNLKNLMEILILEELYILKNKINLK